jgi:hypothetical protein
MSAMYQLVMMQIIYFFNNYPYIVQRIAVWTYHFSYYLGLCTEEICLCLLVRDFRKHLKQQFRVIFSCCGKLKSKFVIGNKSIKTWSSTAQQQQMANGIVVVNSNIVRIANAIGTHPRTKTF